MEQPHFFLAIPLKEEIRSTIEKEKNVLKDQLPFKSWVHRDDLHITLSFLGFANKTKLESLGEIITSLLYNHKSFQLEVANIGIFGQKESPRILWLGIKESSSLRLLQKDIAIGCEQAGFSLETREYRPHITLARKWDSQQQRFQFEKVASLETEMKEDLRWDVEEVVLYQTHLKRIPKYEALHRFSLNK